MVKQNKTSQKKVTLITIEWNNAARHSLKCHFSAQIILFPIRRFTTVSFSPISVAQTSKTTAHRLCMLYSGM
jgi:hypothetical protein